MSTFFSILCHEVMRFSLRAAIALKRIGVNNVWVLEGGLKAWREKAFKSPETPQLVAQRAEVTLPLKSGCHPAVERN